MKVKAWICWDHDARWHETNVYLSQNPAKRYVKLRYGSKRWIWDRGQEGWVYDICRKDFQKLFGANVIPPRGKKWQVTIEIKKEHDMPCKKKKRKPRK